MTMASAGRWTPGSAPRTILAVAIPAPVLPAVKKPAARFSLTILRPRRMELLRLVRTASSGLVLHADELVGVERFRWGDQSRRGRGRDGGGGWAPGPMRWTRTRRVRQARIAPRISGSGALSEPMASRAMSMSIGQLEAASDETDSGKAVSGEPVSDEAVRPAMAVTCWLPWFRISRSL